MHIRTMSFSTNAVLHIPHARTAIPPDLRDSLLLDDTLLAAELVAMTDHLTDRLFELPNAIRVVYPVSRLIVDPERFPDDSKEPMAAHGMGAVYERTSTGGPLRERPSHADRENLLRRFYHPHHAALAAAVACRLEETHNSCLLIDCHSFPSRARTFELDPLAPRPDINLGTDPFHTPPELTAGATAAFEKQGFAVQVDRPYRGTLVPARFYQADSRVRSLMVEVNRRLYLDEPTGLARSDFRTVRARITRALEAFARLS